MESTNQVRRVRSLWNHERIVALLAWIDFCILHKLDFKATVIEHIRGTNGGTQTEGFPHSLSQVLQKLVDLGRQDDEPCSRRDVLERGSRCWKRMPDKTREDTERALELYTEGGLQTKYNSDPIQASDITVASSSNSPDKNESVPTRREKKTDMKEGQLQGSNSPQSGKKTTKYAHVALDPAQSSESFYHTALAQKTTEVATIRAAWYREVDELRATIFRNTKTEVSLRAEIQHLIIARQARELAGKDPLEYELFQLNQTVWSLNRRVYEMQKLATFAQTDEERRDGIHSGTLDELVGRIGDELQMIGVENSGSRAIGTLTVEKNGDLGALLGTIFEDDAEAGDRMESLTRFVSKFGADMLMRTLVAAALRDWVFATAFPNFAPRNVRLLDAYRNVIIVHDGWNRLHNLELAAYDSLIDQDEFREIHLPRKAKVLTSRLLKALVPIFSKPTESLGEDSWGDGISVCEERQFRLSEIFEAALHLKAATVKADQNFEFMIHEPGTVSYLKEGIKTNLGTVENRAPDQGQTNWLLASFHTYASEVTIPRNKREDAIIRSKNMVTKNPEQKNLSTQYRRDILVPSVRPTNLISREAICIDDDNHNSSSDSSRDEKDSDTTYEKGKEPRNEVEGECDRCGRAFTYRRSLNRHKQKNSCAKCLVCDVYFATDVDLRAHNTSNHPRERNRLNIQSKSRALPRLPTPGTFSPSIDTERTIFPIAINAEHAACEDERTIDASVPNIEDFQKMDNRFVCPYCDERYYHKNKFMEHQRQAHREADKGFRAMPKRKRSQVNGEFETNSTKLKVWHETANRWIDLARDDASADRCVERGRSDEDQPSPHLSSDIPDRPCTSIVSS